MIAQQLIETLAIAGLREWGVEQAAPELIKYRENHVYAVRTSAGERAVLRVHRPLYHTADELRSELVPVNRRHPIADLVAACQLFRERTGRRVSLEWAMIDGVNDTDRDAVELAEVARSALAHVNLIPLNPTPGWPTVGSSPERVAAFADRLRSRGVNATVRDNRGTDIDAACGQLAASAGR